MDWPTVVKNLRDNASLDVSRAADHTRRNEPQDAFLLTLSSLVCSRMAMALEKGHIADGVKPLKDVKARKIGSGRRPKGEESVVKKSKPSEGNFIGTRDFLGRSSTGHRKAPRLGA